MNESKNSKKMLFLKIPVRLFDLVFEKESKITPSHLRLYGELWKRATWGENPVETGNLSTKKLSDKLGWKRAFFFRILNDLVKHEFIERIYEDGKKRSSLLKVRFLPDP